MSFRQFLSIFLEIKKSTIATFCDFQKQKQFLVCKTFGTRIWANAQPDGNFNGFRALAVLLHGTRVVGVSQSLRR